jgi:geranylgeranyl reductase family protein
MDEINVVGAGPSGCAAGARAAELGAKVTIYEEHKVVGEPVQCSGIISKRGLDAMGLDYPSVSFNRLRGAWVHLPNGEILKIKSKEVQAFVFDRAKYDRLAVAKAENAGAKLILNTRPNIKKLKGVIVGADGITSDVAREFKFPSLGKHVFCYQEDLDNASIPDPECVHVFVRNSILPGFFAWAIPLGGKQIRLGCGVGMKANSKIALEKLVKREKILQEMLDGAEKFSVLGGVIPMHIREKTVQGRVMLTGDAAGQAKPTTGGGIYFGSMCGAIAGEVAANAKNEKDLLAYETLWRAKYERDLVLNGKIREIADGLSDDEISAYGSFAKRLGAEGFLSRFGDMDHPTRMIKNLDIASPVGRLFSKFAGQFGFSASG